MGDNKSRAVFYESVRPSAWITDRLREKIYRTGTYETKKFRYIYEDDGKIEKIMRQPVDCVINANDSWECVWKREWLIPFEERASVLQKMGEHFRNPAG